MAKFYVHLLPDSTRARVSATFAVDGTPRVLVSGELYGRQAIHDAVAGLADEVWVQKNPLLAYLRGQVKLGEDV